MRFLPIFLLPFLYLCLRMILPLDSWKKRIAGLLFLAVCAFKFPLFALLAPPGQLMPELHGAIQVAGSWCFSLFFFTLFLELATEPIRLVLRLIRRRNLPKGLCNAVNLIILLTSAFLTAWGMDNARKAPEIRQQEVVIEKLPQECDGMRIVLLADLHVDYLTKKEEMEELVRRVNLLHPDLILYAGDYADGRDMMVEKFLPLKKLYAKYGSFAVPGNHEYFSNYRERMKLFNALGITVLENSNYRLRTGLSIAGVGDFNAGRRGFAPPDLNQALTGIPADDCTILLAHQPKFFTESAGKVDLQLSGHTHGGMIRGFDLLVAAFNRGFVSGIYRRNNSTLYVSNGTSLWKGFPLRLGVPAEITLITLHRKEKEL